MTTLLLLYDTLEEDLARDVREFAQELGLQVTMIPRAPDRGMNLDEKEKAYFDSADGACFLLTPGSERQGKAYPSPSLCQELGLVSRFPKERVIYLVAEGCNPPTILQKAYISFDLATIRSHLKTLTRLVHGLRSAGMLVGGPLDTESGDDTPPAEDLSDVELKILELLVRLGTDLDAGFLVGRAVQSYAEGLWRLEQLEARGLVEVIPAFELEPGQGPTFRVTREGRHLVFTRR